MEYSAFLIALKSCFTEREVDRLSARAIRAGIPDAVVTAAADDRLNALLLCDWGEGEFDSGVDDRGVRAAGLPRSQFVY